jgi:hypothetical protein
MLDIVLEEQRDLVSAVNNGLADREPGVGEQLGILCDLAVIDVVDVVGDEAADFALGVQAVDNVDLGWVLGT